MPTQAKFEFRSVRTIFGTPIPKQHFPEGATETFKKGAVCFVGTDGMLTECAAAPALVMGIATADAKNTTAEGKVNQIVELASPGVLYRGYLDTIASEGTGVGTLAMIGQAHGVVKSATGGIWFVSTTDITNDQVVIWQFWDGDNNKFDDQRSHVLFHWNSSKWQGNVGY
jgi:hypothetical protein